MRNQGMRTLFLYPIRFYQKFISPLFPGCCRFHPTCSQYAIEAVSLHGVLKGGMFALWRLMRCNPLCKGGFDPVPAPRKKIPPRSPDLI